MELLFHVAGILYNFFSLLGKLCSAKLIDVFDGMRITASNPWNDNVWTINTNPFGDSVESVGEWILTQLGLGDMLVFDGLLFLTAAIFVIVFLVRLFSASTPD